MKLNICEKCNGEISPVDEVTCSSCGKTYHSFCWNSLPNCTACGAFNEDYSITVKNAVSEANVKNYVGQECKVCGSDMSESDWVVACPDCNMMYHKDCWDVINECSGCGQSFNMRAVNVNKGNAVASGNITSESYSSNNTGMFANIGEKIKGVATFFTVVGIIIGVIIFFAMLAIDGEMFLAGLLIGGVVALISWVSSFMLYGFGALVSSMQKTEELLNEVLDEIKK